MKVLKVIEEPGSISVTVLMHGKERGLRGNSKQIVAKELMKLEHYVTRDTEIIEDIDRVIEEQKVGLR